MKQAALYQQAVVEKYSHMSEVKKLRERYHHWVSSVANVQKASANQYQEND